MIPPVEEAIKKISQVNLWWVKDCSRNTEKLNDKFHLPMGRTFVDLQVTELVPKKKVIWKVTDCLLPWLKDTNEWKDTEIVFELSEKGNSTQIDFTHIVLVPEVEYFDVCEVGWYGHVTNSLVSLINDGKGNPQ